MNKEKLFTKEQEKYFYYKNKMFCPLKDIKQGLE